MTSRFPVALLIGFVVLCAAVALAAIIAQQPRRFGQTRVGGAFTLLDTEGRPVTGADLLGKPSVVYFGFTYCPDVCPTTLFSLTNVLEKMGREADQINLVFVSIDPERDTPEQLKLYLSSFDSRIRGFTGTQAQVDAAAQAYRVSYRRIPTPDGGYTMEHLATGRLFDKAGRLVGEIYYGEDEDRILAKFSTLAQPGLCRPGKPPADLWAPLGMRYEGQACG